MSAARAPGTAAPGVLLGLALGGFFDGILLHQVLQWHHLLSNVRAAALQDIRAQLLADGLFHLLMYVAAVAALALLWKGRGALDHPGAGKALVLQVLLGFGGWHVLDAVLSHWITGIHRVRGDTPDPLFWDLLWLGVFGLVPLAVAWLLRRGGRGASGGGGRGAALVLAVTAVLAGPMAAWPAAGSDQVLVLFRPGMEGAPAFDALARVDARVLWVDRSGGLWAVQLDDPHRARSLHASGALLVSAGSPVLGCFGWSRV